MSVGGGQQRAGRSSQPQVGRAGWAAGTRAAAVAAQPVTPQRWPIAPDGTPDRQSYLSLRCLRLGRAYGWLSAERRATATAIAAGRPAHAAEETGSVLWPLMAAARQQRPCLGPGGKATCGACSPLGATAAAGAERYFQTPMVAGARPVRVDWRRLSWPPAGHSLCRAHGWPPGCDNSCNLLQNAQGRGGGRCRPACGWPPARRWPQAKDPPAVPPIA